MRRRWLKALLASTSLCAAAPLALANPVGGQVVGGSGSIVQSPATPNRLVIDQNSQDLFINWQSFNVGAGQQVIFQQPNAAAIALNRVTGNAPSTIGGLISANGQVWLVNPNGVFFTGGAVVNVAGIVVTTSEISQANFTAGNQTGSYVFDQPGAANASIVNAGKVSVRDAGLAAFVAPSVANSGVIEAKLGKVSLVSGSKFTVDLYGDNLVKLAVDDQTAATLAGAAVSNSGTIQADGGTVTLSVGAAETLVNQAINVSGTVEARTASMQNGKIVLSGGGGQVAVSGTLDASGTSAGATGGTVEVLGGAVSLAGTANINVSGNAGGGTALIGGDFHGAGPLPNAQTTTIAAGASIDADATASGNGGNVAVWSDAATYDAGSITARGGQNGGNGGFVETSSGQQLTIADGAIVNTGAPSGTGGEWLLDPTEIDITTANLNVSPSSPFTTTMSTGSTVSNATIDAALGTGSVLIETSTNDIAVDAPIVPVNTGGANGSLGLDSAAGIVLNANINFAQATGGASSGNLLLLAGTSITQTSGTLTFAGGLLSMSAANAIGTAANPIAVAGATAGTTVGIAATTTTSGGVFISGGTGTLAVSDAPSQAISGFTFAAVDGVSAVGAVSISGGAVTIGAPVSGSSIAVTGSSGITFDYSAGALATSSGGGQTYDGAITLAANATLTDSAGGPITFMNTIDASTAGAETLTVTDTTGTVALQGTVGGMTPLGAVSLSDATLDVSGNVNVVTSGGAFGETGATVLLGGAGTSSTIDTTAGGTATGANISFSSTIDDTMGGVQALSLTAGAAGTITLSGAVGSNVALGALTASAGGPLAIANSITTSGDISLASGGAITVTAAINADGGGTIALAAGGALSISAEVGSSDAGAISLSGATVDLTAGIDGGASLTIGPSSGAANIGLGNATADAFFLTQAEINEFGPDLTALSIATSTGTVHVDNGGAALTFDTAVTIAGGSIALLDGGGLATSGNALTLAAPVALANSATLNTTLNGNAAGANVTIEGAVTASGMGTQTLTITAGTGGTITLDGSVGTVANPLGAVTLTDAALDLAANVGITTDDAAVSQSGATVLGGGTATSATITTSGGAITFGAIDGTTSGDQTLVLNAGTGAVTLAGSIGAHTPLAALTLTDNQLVITGNVDIALAGTGFSQTGPTELEGGGGATAVTISTSGGNITFGTITADTAGERSLSLLAGTGTIMLNGSLGAPTALGAVTFTDTALDLAANVGITTDDGAVSETGATVLAGAVATATTIATSGGNITFGKIDGTTAGDQALSLLAGGGTITLNANLGGTTPLGAVTLSDATLDIAGNANVTTQNGAVSQTGATVLGPGASTTTIATSNGDISFSSTINASTHGQQALTLLAGTGTITLDGNLGAGTALGAVTLSDGGLDLSANVGITTFGANVSQTGPTELTGGVTATTNIIATSGGNITFSGTIDGDTAGLRALTLNAGGGTISLAGSLGTPTALGAVTLTDATLDLSANVGITTDDAAVSQTGATVLGGATATIATIATSGGAINFGAIDGTTSGDQWLILNAGTGAVTLAGSIGAHTPLFALNLTDNQLVINGNVDIALAGTGFSQTGPTELEGGGGATAVTISTSGGAITFGTITADSAGKRSLSLLAGSGLISLLGNIGAPTALGAVTLSDSELDLAPNVGITTDDGAVSQTGLTVLGFVTATATTIATSGGDISFGKIDGVTAGDQALSLLAGGGTITLNANLGGTTPLGAVTLSDATLDIAANANITTLDGAFSQTGATVFMGAAASTSTINTSDANITFAGTIDGGTRGLQALTLEAGTGTISFQGNAGANTALGALTLDGAAFDLGRNVTVTTSGGAVVDSGTLSLAGGANAGTAAIDTTDGGLSTGANVTLMQAVNATGAGKQGLTIDAGSFTITLGGNVGATTALGAVTLTDATLSLPASFTLTTAGGAVLQTGATDLLGEFSQTTTTIATNSGGLSANITFDGTIDGFLPGAQSLVLTAGANGTVSLLGLVGVQGALGAITLNGHAIDIGADVQITTIDGAFTANAPVSLLSGGGGTGGLAIATDGGNITFASTIDGTSTGRDELMLDAGGGIISLQGNVGAGTPLGEVTVTNATLDLSADVGILTAGGQIMLDVPIVLGGAGATTTTISTTGGGDPGGNDINIGSTVTGTIAGDQALTLNAGTLGVIGLNASLGNPTPLGAVTLHDGQLDLGANVGITTANGAFSQTGATQLQGAGPTLATIDTTDGGLAAGANIAIGSVTGTVAGDQSLDLVAGSGTVSILGSVGAPTALGAVSATGAAVEIGANANITANTSVELNGPLVLLGAAASSTTIAAPVIELTSTVEGTTAGDQALTLNVGGGVIDLEGNVGATTALGALTLTDATLEMNPGVSITTAGGAVTESGTTFLLAGLGATTTVIDTTNAGHVAGGADIAFAGSIIGGSAGSQALTLDAGTGGTVTLSGDVGALIPLGAVRLIDATTLLSSGAGILTDNGAITATSAIVLLAGGGPSVTTFDTTDNGFTAGANITISGGVEGTTAGEQSVVLDAGDATIALTGNFGRTTPLGALTLSAALLELGPDSTISTDGHSFTAASPVILLSGAGATTIDTTGGGLIATGADITFASTINDVAAGQQGLTLIAGTTGTIALDGNVGATAALGAFTASDAQLDLASGVSITTAGGAVSQTGATLLAGAVTIIDTTDAGHNGAGANIALAGPVDGSFFGAQALTLLAGTGGTITLGGNLGGTTALGAVTLSDATLDLGASVITAGGAIVETGATNVTAPASLDTTDAGFFGFGTNVALAGTVNGAALSVNAGTSGTITLNGTVGGNGGMTELTLRDATLDIGLNVAITTTASFSETGATLLPSGVAMAPTATDITSSAITFDGAIDGAAAGLQSLSLHAATVTLQGDIGSQVALGALTLTAGTLDIGPDVTITTKGGAVTQTWTGASAIVLQADGGIATDTVIDTTEGGLVPLGANINLAGTIDGGAPGLQSLALNAGTSGTITLQSNLGATTPLGAVSLSDATLALGASITTLGGAFTETGVATLTGAAGTSVIDTTGAGAAPIGADITFTATIDDGAAGRNGLTLDAGTGGTLSLGGTVGGTTPLGAISLSDATLALGLGVNFATAGGAFSETGATLLAAGPGATTTLVNTTADAHPLGASITFDGTIDGSATGMQALTLDAGTQGTIALMGTVGGATPLGAVSLSDATLTLGSGVTLGTAGGAVSETGATTLLGGASAIDTAEGGDAAGANIAFSGTIDGAAALTLDAGTGGTITLGGDAGAHTALGALTMSGAALNLAPDLSLTTAGGAVAETGTIAVGGGNAMTSLTIDTTAGGTVPAGADITLGALDGATPGKLALDLKAGTGGTIALLGSVGSTASLASITLSDAVLELGANVDITTAGTPFSESGATVLLANGANPTVSVIDTTGADITFAGAINGGAAGLQSLTLDAGTATITLSGPVGATVPLGAITLDDNLLELGANASIATAGGAVTETGATRLLAGPPPVAPAMLSSNVTIDTAAGGVTAGAAITFDGTIDGATTGGEALALNAGTGGTITLAANAGANTALGGLTLADGTADLGGSLYQTVNGAISVGGTTNFTMPNVSVTTTTHVALGSPPLSPGAAVTFNNVNGTNTTLTLDPGNFAAMVGGGALHEIAIIEGSGSTLVDMIVDRTSLGGTGIGIGMIVGGQGGANAAKAAFIRPGGIWTINFADVLITDPALAGLTNSVLSNLGIGPAIALMVQIQELIARGDTGETAAQQAFDQFPDRSNYAVDPFHQRYNILGVAQQEGVGGFEDISYIQDGFWEGLLKTK